MFRRSGRGRLLLIAFLALSIAIITLDFQEGSSGPLEKAKDIAGEVVAPIQRGVSTVVRPVRNFFASLGDLGRLRDETERLQNELAQAQVTAQRATELEEQIKELTRELDLNARWFTMKAVAVEVISKVAHNYRWAVTISKGSEDGIRPNMAVIDGSAGTGGGLVGKTVEPVTDDYATVLFLVDPQGAAAAKIEKVDDTGAVTGNGMGEPLSMEHVQPSSDVKIGQSVVTSYYNSGIFPPGIPIGTISAIQEDEAELEPEIDVEPVVDFENLETLQVLLETGPIKDQGKPKKGKKR